MRLYYRYTSIITPHPFVCAIVVPHPPQNPLSLSRCRTHLPQSPNLTYTYMKIYSLIISQSSCNHSCVFLLTLVGMLSSSLFYSSLYLEFLFDLFRCPYFPTRSSPFPSTLFKVQLKFRNTVVLFSQFPLLHMFPLLYVKLQVTVRVLCSSTNTVRSDSLCYMLVEYTYRLC